MFEWSANEDEDSFFAKLSLLNLDEKHMLKDRILQKYNVTVVPDQIVNLLLSEIKCNFKLKCTNAAKKSKQKSQTLIQFDEKVENFGKFPLSLVFKLTPHLESHLECIKTDCARIYGANLKELGLLNEIFGDL